MNTNSTTRQVRVTAWYMEWVGEAPYAMSVPFEGWQGEAKREFNLDMTQETNKAKHEKKVAMYNQ